MIRPSRARRIGLRFRLMAAGLTLLGPAEAGAQRPLTVFAAASLTDAFRALGATFGARHPGAPIRFNFAGTPQLVLQLSQGARADVFATADDRWMQAAQDSGLLAGMATLFAGNRLVVALPRGNPAGIHGLQDLARPGVKLAFAADAVPAGRYARELLHRLSRTPGFGPDYEPRVVANVVSLEESVRGVLSKVLLGEVDAGIVYRSDVAGPAGAQLRILEVPDAAGVPVRYPIAVVRGSRNETQARAFIALVLSPEGQATLGRFGFEPAPAE